MKISRLIIKNYRNLKDIDICLGVMSRIMRKFIFTVW